MRLPAAPVLLIELHHGRLTARGDRQSIARRGPWTVDRKPISGLRTASVEMMGGLVEMSVS